MEEAVSLICHSLVCFIWRVCACVCACVFVCVLHVIVCTQSDDSMEHLSAEERACLLFLEETIESLEMEEDSGLANDGSLAETFPPSISPMVQTSLNGENI